MNILARISLAIPSNCKEILPVIADKGTVFLSAVIS